MQDDGHLTQTEQVGYDHRGHGVSTQRLNRIVQRLLSLGFVPHREVDKNREVSPADPGQEAGRADLSLQA